MKQEFSRQMKQDLLLVEERLERSVYLGADRTAIAAKFVDGERVL